MNKISVIGLGYIGLPTATILASKNIDVLGVDIDQEIVDIVNKGKVHIVEPDLDELVYKTVDEGYLRASTSLEPSEIYIICVPTPFEKQEYTQIPTPDLSFIKNSCSEVAKVLKKGDVVILESTSPVGTTEKISEWMSEIRLDLSFPHEKGSSSDIRVAYCPERVLPGQVLQELTQNDRVIGGITKKCSEAAKKVYEVFVDGNCHMTNSRTAEMAKLTENASRDVSIAFANELSMICENLEIDVWKLIELANKHPRINILEPGPGVGGHCIAVDPWFIASRSPKDSTLIQAARQVNDSKPIWVINQVKAMVNRYLEDNPKYSEDDIVLGCYGLTFKADIDDLRESPALNIVNILSKDLRCKIVAVEPNIKSSKLIHQEVELVSFEYSEENSNIHILLVDHKEFSERNIKSEYLIDTKGLWKEI